jgi:hypothetical protein
MKRSMDDSIDTRLDVAAQASARVKLARIEMKKQKLQLRHDLLEQKTRIAAEDRARKAEQEMHEKDLAHKERLLQAQMHQRELDYDERSKQRELELARLKAGVPSPGAASAAGGFPSFTFSTDVTSSTALPYPPSGSGSGLYGLPGAP